MDGAGASEIKEGLKLRMMALYDQLELEAARGTAPTPLARSSANCAMAARPSAAPSAARVSRVEWAASHQWW